MCEQARDLLVIASVRMKRLTIGPFRSGQYVCIRAYMTDRPQTHLEGR